MSEARHSRQARLAEVGEGGQERIQSAVARIASSGARGMIAARYAAGAGVGRLEVCEAAVAAAAREIDRRVVVAVVARRRSEARTAVGPDAEPAWIRDLDPAARAVAAGAYEALTALRAALGEGS